MRYTTSTEKIDNGKGYWGYLKVSVFKQVESGPYCNAVKIGEYTRNYSTFFNTFRVFSQNNKDYALISEKYNGFAVYSLDPFEKISENLGLFEGQLCPVDFYVPTKHLSVCEYDRKTFEDIESTRVDETGQHGFMEACFWGNDFYGMGNNLFYLDLSDLKSVKVINLNTVMPPKVKLEDAVFFELSELYEGKKQYIFSVAEYKELDFNNIRGIKED